MAWVFQRGEASAGDAQKNFVFPKLGDLVGKDGVFVREKETLLNDQLI